MSRTSAAVLSFSLLLTSGIYAQKETSIKLGFRDFLFDFWIGEEIGGKEASPDIEQYIRKMCKDAHLSNADTIRIRRITPYQSFGKLLSLGNDKSHLYDFLLFPKYIYIDENYLKTLPKEQQRFLIGCEIMRLKYKHDLLFWLAQVAHGFTHKKIGEPAFPLALILNSIIAKALEVHADYSTAAQFDVLDGGINLMNRFIEDEVLQEKEMPQWKLLKSKRSFYRFISNLSEIVVGWKMPHSWRLKLLKNMKNG